MSKHIQIVDRGRGMQLSTSRITVQDLVPYFVDGCSYEYIKRAMPTLSDEEIQTAEGYFNEHKSELLEEDRLIRLRSDAMRNPSWVEEIANDARQQRRTRETQNHQQNCNPVNGNGART